MCCILSNFKKKINEVLCNKLEIYRNPVKRHVDFSVDVDIDVVFACVYPGVGNDGFFFYLNVYLI